MSEKDGEDVLSVNVDAAIERVGEEDRVRSFRRVKNPVQISRLRRQEMIPLRREKNMVCRQGSKEMIPLRRERRTWFAVKGEIGPDSLT